MQCKSRKLPFSPSARALPKPILRRILHGKGGRRAGACLRRRSPSGIQPVDSLYPPRRGIRALQIQPRDRTVPHAVGAERRASRCRGVRDFLCGHDAQWCDRVGVHVEHRGGRVGEVVVA